MPRTESVGEENYRTHKFINFLIAATHYDAAMVEANEHLKEIQGALQATYVLHMVVKAELKGWGTKRVTGKRPHGSKDQFLFRCEIFARAVRAENNRFKHIRQCEIHELDTFAKGYNVGLSLGLTQNNQRNTYAQR